MAAADAFPPEGSLARASSLLTEAEDPRYAATVLKTLKRRLTRLHDPRAVDLRMVLFEWPSGGTGHGISLRDDFPGEELPYEYFARWGSTAEFGRGRRDGIGWAYDFRILESGHPAATRVQDVAALLETAAGILGQCWPLVVAEVSPAELARRLTWGNWADLDAGAPSYRPERSATPGSPVAPATPDWPATRCIPGPRAEAVPHVVSVEDYVLASLVTMDCLASAAAALATERPASGIRSGGQKVASDNPDASGDVAADSQHGRQPRPPTREEWRAWALCNFLGCTQVEASDRLSDEFGGNWYQSRVHRVLKTVEDFLHRGGSIPAELRPPKRAREQRVRTLDPANLDRGSPTRHTRRPRPDAQDEPPDIHG